MKKFLALALSMLLVLGMSTAVFAEGAEPAIGSQEPSATPEYQDNSTVKFKKTYRLIGEGISPAETFTLYQSGKNVIDGEATDADVPDLGTITGAYFAEGAATAEGATGEITIALPEFEQVGVYEYILKEQNNGTAGVKYHDGQIRLIVTVINAADGNTRIAAAHAEMPNKGKNDTFENTYSAGDLTITKTVAGNLGDKEKFFKFTVGLMGQSNLTYPTSYEISGGSHIENPTSMTNVTPTTFYLKDGESITISNLPYGLEFTIQEDNYGADGYETTYVRSSNDNVIEAPETTVAYTNTKDGSIDTGVVLDNLPYVVIIAAVVGVGVTMLIKRRHTER